MGRRCPSRPPSFGPPMRDGMPADRRWWYGRVMGESSIVETIRNLAERARTASRGLARADRATKDRALGFVANRLRTDTAGILAANKIDLDGLAAKARGGADGQTASATAAFRDRLMLDAHRIEHVARAVDHVALLEDPVGAVTGMTRRPNGLLVGQVRVPLGVIAMVYEARPNVTVDAAALCVKSGNSVLLRGGSEAAASNQALGEIVRAGIADAGLPPDAVQVVPAGDREATRALLGLTGLIDLAIPRGGEGLVRFVSENAKVPVIQHYQGVCHLFVDEGCDRVQALKLIVDGKTVRPAVCNALECLLVHEREAAGILPLVSAMAKDLGVELRGCPKTVSIISDARHASASDFGREFLDKILAIRVVAGIDEALEHVNRFGSGHTEAICTRGYEHAQRWLQEVDASCVLVNASTRFNDGGELGLGAEIGISTSKLHAYGPMGLESMTTKKWIVYGEGQVRG
jgi:glutamate-5-semialdehyde dehydrogenase